MLHDFQVLDIVRFVPHLSEIRALWDKPFVFNKLMEIHARPRTLN